MVRNLGFINIPFLPKLASLVLRQKWISFFEMILLVCSLTWEGLDDGPLGNQFQYPLDAFSLFQVNFVSPMLEGGHTFLNKDAPVIDYYCKLVFHLTSKLLLFQIGQSLFFSQSRYCQVFSCWAKVCTNPITWTTTEVFSLIWNS